MENMKNLMPQIGNEQFDYTKWRRDNLCVGMTAEEISKEAMELWNATYGEEK